MLAQFASMATMINVISTLSVASCYWLLWRIPEPLADTTGSPQVVHLEMASPQKAGTDGVEEFGIYSRESTLAGIARNSK